MKKIKRRALKGKVTALVAAASVLGTSMPVLASDTLPYIGESAKGENQAYAHGYRAEDLLDWSPETDPNSELMRARVPLQKRNAPLAATQANPKLNSETEYFTLTGDYGNAFFDAYQYTNEFSQYLFNFWQYADYYGSWHGLPTEEVPEELYQNERGVVDSWKYRKFEFGLVNAPNAAYTNAAHKNGVLSIGCIFLPRTGLKHTALLTQNEDGSFPYAAKLAEMCKYYGFDGWFINQEEKIPTADIPLYKQFMKQLRDDGVYVQWYDSIHNETGAISYENEFNIVDSPFVKEGDTQYSDSIFLNYWWDADKLKDSAAHAKSLGLNPLDTVFVGIEAGGDRWDQKYDLRLNLGEDGQPMNAIASLGTDFVHSGLDEDFDGGNDNVAMRREKDEFQWMAFERERRWWSGPFQDPTKASSTADRKTYADNKDIAIGTQESQTFDGVAAYITERSVINGDTFVTNFNTGHGMEYKIRGNVSNSNEWSNINIQDILPTWQWWIESKDGNLNVDFDYGSKLAKNYDNGKDDPSGKSGSFDYKQVGAYSGGSSLVIYGDAGKDDYIHLYKTDLDVKEDTHVNVTFQKVSSDNAKLQLGLIFADDTDNVVKLDINNTDKAGDWVKSSVDLSSYAGRKIASIGLAVSDSAKDYQINVGRLAYLSSKKMAAPATPTGLTIDKAYDTGEMVISWDLASYDKVKQYNVYTVKDGKEIYLGGTYDDIFYIKDIYNTDGKAAIRVKAVSEEGKQSKAAKAIYDYSKAVKDVKVTAEDGKLNVSWTGPDATVSVQKAYSTDNTIWSAEGEQSAIVEVPKGADADGARYNMLITTADGTATAYDGRMDDSYCKPYTGSVKNGALTAPLPKDWYKLTYKTITPDGPSTETTITRYESEMPNVAGADDITVVLEDYKGNRSEEVTIHNNTAIAVSSDTEADTIKPGETKKFAVEVRGDKKDEQVVWTVERARSENTKVEIVETKDKAHPECILTLGADETASSVTVKCSLSTDASIWASSVVKVEKEEAAQ